MKKWLNKAERALLWALPLVVFASYYPVIRLGSNEQMNFELSLPLIWLAIFGCLSLLRLPKIWREFGAKKILLVSTLPIFMTVSVLWSTNRLRGFLVAGILDLLILSGLNIASRSFKKVTLRKFAIRHMIGGAIVGIICLLQCFLDVFGATKDKTLLCPGCGYEVFGFPHPNGLAIEPQFMGNLLIAPAILSLYFTYNAIISKKDKSRAVLFTFLSFLNILALYICFSRGALYAFILSLIFFAIKSAWKAKHKIILFTVYFGTSAVAFAGGLLLQGLLAEFSTTSESFPQGIARAIHHVSLGKIDLRKAEPVENTKEVAIFNGYIEESTDIRLSLNEEAVLAWKKSPATFFFGVGLGGAGVAIHENSGVYSAKEIVQNQFLSILLETGCVGFAALIISLGSIMIFAKKRRSSVIFWALLLAYIISLNFFSGLPNALHIYLLMPVWLRFGARDKYVKIG